MNWLKEFGEKFDQVTENHPRMKRHLGFARIEQAVQACPDYSAGRMSRDVLGVIFDKQEWPYHEWWRDLSDRLPRPIRIGHDFGSPDAKRKAGSKLHRYLADIGVVSVILRFWCPKEFGIVSPPVEWILSLAPSRYPVDSYLCYLENLKALAKQYGFNRLADVDMALWSAAHLLNGESELAEKMNNDKYFERVRLVNLLRGLGENWRGTVVQQLNLSKSLLKHDHFTAALVAARPFQWALSEIAIKNYEVQKWTRRIEQDKKKKELEYYVDELAGNPQFLRDFGATITLSKEVENRGRRSHEAVGMTSTRLHVLRRIRNTAVHYDEVKREDELKPDEAKEFIANIDKLLCGLIRGPASQ